MRPFRHLMILMMFLAGCAGPAANAPTGSEPIVSPKIAMEFGPLKERA
jgi:hypothetical protein